MDKNRDGYLTLLDLTEGIRFKLKLDKHTIDDAQIKKA